MWINPIIKVHGKVTLYPLTLFFTIYSLTLNLKYQMYNVSITKICCYLFTKFYKYLNKRTENKITEEGKTNNNLKCVYNSIIYYKMTHLQYVRNRLRI